MNQPTVNQTVQHGSRFSFRSPQGYKGIRARDYRLLSKAGSFTRLAKVDRRIDNRLSARQHTLRRSALMRIRGRVAGTTSKTRCSLQESSILRPKTDLARDAASELVQ
jgi:hypothetical protein